MPTWLTHAICTIAILCVTYQSNRIGNERVQIVNAMPIPAQELQMLVESDPELSKKYPEMDTSSQPNVIVFLSVVKFASGDEGIVMFSTLDVPYSSTLPGGYLVISGTISERVNDQNFFVELKNYAYAIASHPLSADSYLNTQPFLGKLLVLLDSIKPAK